MDMQSNKFIIVIFFTLSALALATGQSNGCDGNRYLNAVFNEVKTTKLAYGRNVSLIGDTVDLFMDLYEPVGDIVQARAAVVLAFGGAFISGDRFQLAELGNYFAKHGYVVACIDYRIWPVFVKGFPDSLGVLDVAVKAMGDMKASIRYLKSIAKTYRIDSNLVFVGGVSAGAITAIQTAYLDENDAQPNFIKNAINQNGGLQGNSNNSTLQHSSKVRGVLNLSGAILSLDWLDAGEPPMVSMHGTADNVVIFGEGKAAGILTLQGSGVIHPALKTKGIKELLIAVPGGNHTDIYIDARYQVYVDSLRLAGKKMFNQIICQQTVSSRTLAGVEKIKVYPSPAVDYVLIEGATVPLSVALRDMTGRKIPSQQNGNRIEWKYGIASGIYVLEAVFANNKKAISKVVVSR